MTQTDIIVKALALIGLFYILRCIALLVIRMDGYDLKSHRHCYLHTAVAAVTLCIGWAYLKFEPGSPVRLLVEHNNSEVVERPPIVSRHSFLLSEEPIAIEIDLETSFDFESSQLFSYQYTFSELKDSKHVHQPYVQLHYEDEDSEIVVIEVEKALRWARNMSEAMNDISANVQELPWSAKSDALTPSTRLNSKAGDIWSSVQANVKADGKNFIWNRQPPLIEADQKPPFDFDVYVRFEILRDTNYNNPNSWAASPGAVQRVVQPKVTPQRGTIDVPGGAPYQQIKGLMQATPGFYETIPELQRFLNR